MDSADTLFTLTLGYDGTNALIQSWSLKPLVINGQGNTVKFGAAISPLVSDGAALGTSSLMWSDIFVASGGVLNFNNGNFKVTHDGQEDSSTSHGQRYRSASRSG